jgi:hypothetical protein
MCFGDRESATSYNDRLENVFHYHEVRKQDDMIDLEPGSRKMYLIKLLMGAVAVVVALAYRFNLYELVRTVKMMKRDDKEEQKCVAW